MALHAFTPDLARNAGLPENRFPNSDAEADLAEEVLTKELQKLSVDEHEKLLFDIHGLSRGGENEDEGFIMEKLQEVEDYLSKMKRNKKAAYERAKFLNQAYCESRDFRMMFLRSEQYNTKAAAKTIVKHFEIKQKIFGDGEILAREVRQDDLNEEDHEKLRDGFIQVMPERDAAGRTIICLNLGFKREDKLASPLSRSCWYFEMTVMKDTDAQKHGVVYVMYNFVKHREEVSFQREIHQLRNALPQRTHAAHYCYDDRKLRPFVTGIRLFMDPNSRFRLRPHFGKPEDIEFELQTFGIPTQHSPMQKDATWSTDWHLEWLHMTREKESLTHCSFYGKDESPEQEDIIVPRRFDVLFGRGKIAKTHTGNLRALHLCEMNYPRYESSVTGKYGKTEVAEQIVAIIHESKGRFLRPCKTGGWEEVDDEAAREKISHFFRHMRHKVKKQQKASENSPCEESSSELSVESPALSSSRKQSIGVKRVTSCQNPSPVDYRSVH